MKPLTMNDLRWALDQPNLSACQWSFGRIGSARGLKRAYIVARPDELEWLYERINRDTPRKVLILTNKIKRALLARCKQRKITGCGNPGCDCLTAELPNGEITMITRSVLTFDLLLAELTKYVAKRRRETNEQG